MQTMISAVGLLTMILCAWGMSSHRSVVPWRVIIGGLLLQFAFASFILKTEVGRQIFEVCGSSFNALISCVDAGSDFLFDFAATESGLGDATSGVVAGPRRYHVLASVAFRVLPTIVFFSSLMSMLYHVGIAQRVVTLFAWIMQRTLGTSGAESLSAAANIFVGQTEAPLVVRPYIPSMTLSEINAVMVGGFATIAGGVLAAYVKMGIDAGHLIAASVISAPASLLIAKVMVPETEHPQTMGTVRIKIEKTSQNLLQAATEGAADGMKLALNVGAMLIAFLALVGMFNMMLGWFSVQTGFAPVDAPWQMEMFLGWLFYPFAWLMGIPVSECQKAGELLGIKTVTNEFLAYEQLARWDKAREISPRTVMILSYAMCGFANLGSIGIQIGGIGSLAESRKGDLAKLGFRAMLGGTLASFMTACVAGILIPDGPLRPRPVIESEPIGQHLRQVGDTGGKLWLVGVDQPNNQVRREFGHDLSTCSTGSDATCGRDCYLRDSAISGRNRISNDAPFGTNG